MLAALGVRAVFTAPPHVAARMAAAMAFVFAALFVVVPAARESFFFIVPRAGWVQTVAGYAPLAVWFAVLSLLAAGAPAERSPGAGLVPFARRGR